MPVLDLYSYRKRLAAGNTPDVFTYDELPDALRVQIVHIWRRAIGQRHDRGWTWIHNRVAEEHGRFELADGYGEETRCTNFLLQTASVDQALDLIEVSFRFIERIVPKFTFGQREAFGITTEPSDAIEDLNERFRRAGVGYQLEDGQIFRVEPELVESLLRNVGGMFDWDRSQREQTNT